MRWSKGVRGEVRGPFPLRRLRSAHQSTCRSHQASGANGGDLLWRGCRCRNGPNPMTTTNPLDRIEYARQLYLTKLISLLKTEADMDRIERLLGEWFSGESAPSACC